MNAIPSSGELARKGDFIEIKFTGYVEGKPFDSNITEDLKHLNEKATPEKTIVIIGEQMVVRGLDKAFENKELNKEYRIKLTPQEGFGQRRREFVKTIPLKVFSQQRVHPRPGVTLLLDNQLARIITVSGARVITDFNNPLAGKELEYKFTIMRIVTDKKEKAEAACKLIFQFVPEIEITENTITIKGPEILEQFINHNQAKFKELLGTEVLFQEAKTPANSEAAQLSVQQSL